ncbi:uncharacterized protein Dana_GF23511 [Drosophila ananassae]|uniref:Uncharacterized protein n=1 Tax=Drosophila ananassae TaxID=7217 RepID=B3MA39_DROAN|nr:uncharacterized protein LOC6506152 [Drosophila ananassae]EDV41259.1 uncharacterized protein Dana_GF23511 [Drosophila ananassae]
MASATVWLILILGLRWSGALDSHTPNNDSKLLAALNSSAPAQEVLFHIDIWRNEAPVYSHFDVWTNEAAVGALAPAGSSALESLIRAEVGGDWERGKLVLQLANEAKTLELKEAIYTALWKELQQTKQIYDPMKILQFHEQLRLHTDVPQHLMELIYQAFVHRSAQFLEAPFHTNSPAATFPLVNSLMERLTFSTLDYLRDILEVLYNAVLALETPLSVVERLANFTTNLTQMAQANLQLLAREELRREDPKVQLALQSNLRDLLEQPGFEQEVAVSLRTKIYAHLPKDEQLLYTARKVCIRNVTDNTYIYECPQTYLICSNARDLKKAAYFIQRENSLDSRPKFAFYSAYWRNRYILMEPSAQTGPNANHSITKNVYSRNNINWWRVVYEVDGISLYDAVSEGSVLCGGDPAHWDSEEHHVYTRRASEFAAHRGECTWSLEDCSDAA